MTDDSAGSSSSPPSPWRVKYDGACSRCGIALLAGTAAIYDRPTRSIHCVTCPSGDDAGGPDVIEPALGVAGGSAMREYERRRDARDVRVKHRFGRRLGGVLLALTDEPQSTRAWRTGARGEEQLAAALADIEGIAVLHDRRMPRRQGNIDHIVVAPAGVFVVDAKRYQGRIEIRNRGNIFRPDHRLYVGRRDCSELAEKVLKQASTVKEALTADLQGEATPVLCFVDGEWPLISPPSTFRGVRLETPRSLRKLLTTESVLDRDAIAGLARQIAAALPPM